MKKVTLLFAALLLTVVGAQAVSVTRQITLTFANDATNGISWNAGTNSTSGSTLTFSGSWSASGWTFNKPVNLIGFKFTSATRDTELTFEFKDTNNTIDYYSFWGTDNLGETDFNLAAMTEGADLTKVKSITFNPRAGAEGTSVTFGTITMTIQIDGYDEVINTYEKNSFTLSDANFSNTIWGTAEQNVVNTSTGQISYSESGNAVGWVFSPAIDLTQYDRMVVKVHPQSVSYSGDWWLSVCLFLDVDGKGDNDVYMERFNSATNNEDSYFTREIDLTQTLKSGDSHDGSDVDVSAVTRFRFRTEAAGLSFQIDEIYLEKDGIQYLVRSNVAADKYGTICLPFAASKPSNATVYDVVGYAETAGSPSALYLEAVDAMEAGKAYVFKSGNAEDITFTKTGTDDNMVSPAESTNMLHGQFSGTSYVPQYSYILVGTQWKKVTVANQNTVSNYRAYLTLTEDLKVTIPPAGARIMNLDGGETTGIESVQGALFMANGSEIYDLSGRRVSQPTKGIYVKNGKKYIVK